MTEHKVTMESTLKVLLEQKKYSTLKDILITMNPSDVAELFEEIADERLPRLFRLLPKEQAAETFVEMQPEQQELLIRGFSDAELRAVVEELYVDDAVDLVEEMPANVVKRILAQADPEMRKDINNLLRYPENSAGSIMTTEYVSLRPQMTVIQAIDRIRKTGVDKETIYTCYVTEARKLLGTVSVKDLLLATDDSLPVASIMDENVISVSTLTDQEEVGHHHLRRRDGCPCRRDHRRHREDGRYASLGKGVSALLPLGAVQAPDSLAGSPDGVGDVHGNDHHGL